ncbi:DASH complex subunit DAM1 [Paramyrothecium foliicola]|nr:DASH complex subunit DAM1 [Paramyrothecium foliicola]
MSTDFQASADKRSMSRTRNSRPTTPLRPSSRSSFRDSARSAGDGDAPFPLNAFEPAFAELADSMADLEANMMHFQLMHESLARFSESFASFLYGLNMNAFCVDFPEGPGPESFRRDRETESQGVQTGRTEPDTEATFMQDYGHVFRRKSIDRFEIRCQANSNRRASLSSPRSRYFDARQVRRFQHARSRAT